MNSFYKRLYGAYRRGRLGHGLLLVSFEEKKESFERDLAEFIQALTCTESTDEGACGACGSCRLLQSSYPPPPHPDIACLKPESPTSGYAVEQIRSLHEKLSLSLSLAENRVAWIAQAEGLGGGGATAGHAFLKGLEEPRPRSFLILTSSQPSLILATLRSRCQAFRLPAPQESLDDFERDSHFKDWLELKGWLRKGAPLGESFSSPADEDAFWQDRGVALSELEELYVKLWNSLREEHWAQWERSASQRVLDFFLAFEKLIQSIRFYAQPQLQWLSLRSGAKVGNLWKQ